MSHQRSQSSSSSILNEHNINTHSNTSNSSTTAPLSIAVPRRRSSFSFSAATSTGAMATSPVAAFSASSASGISPNPFFNPISPSSVTSSANVSTSNATPSSTLASFSSIPSSLNRRFSANFTNPLTTAAVSSPTSPDDRGRRQSYFGSSPPASRQFIDRESSFNNNLAHTHDHVNTDGGGGGGSGIGALFRKFSVSGRSGNAQHSIDRNEPGPVSQDIPNIQSHGSSHPRAVDALKTSPSQKEQTSRSSSPMRNMILNGQMLD
ncbi:hypothetical protein FBU30_002214 [Linnemannia zychae]|nr:hypothetical protein FBU30_002214 [Linnemannia zychae]